MFNKIQKIIKEYKGEEDLVITEDSTFADLGLDSLDTVEIAMQIEEECNITIEMNNSIKTVADLINQIENKEKTDD